MIRTLEKQQKQEQQKKNMEFNNEQERQLKEIQADKIKARMNKVVQHEGRIQMWRAPKPERKKVEKKLEISEEKLAQLKYLGDLDELMAMHQLQK